MKKRKKYEMKKYILSGGVFLLFAFILFSPKPTLGQTFSGLNQNGTSLQEQASDFTPSINLISLPEHPAPYQEVSLTLESSLVKVKSDPISWLVNGVEKEQGRGVNTFTTSVGAAGASVTIKAVISDTQFGRMVKSITFTPGSVDVLWEAETYTPPFYRGKALASPQSTVKLVAVPQVIGGGSPGTFTYTWKEGYTKQDDLSGYGRQSATITAPYSGFSNIKVLATSQGDITAVGTVKVIPVDPLILFYPEDPTLGVLYKQLLPVGAESQNGGILKISAVPYYFSFTNPNNNPGKYNWMINNKEVTPGSEKSSVALKFPSGGAVANIQLSIINTNRLLQSSQGALTLSF